MTLLHRAQRTLVPWFAYALLQGVGAGLLLGVLITLSGLVMTLSAIYVGGFFFTPTFAAQSFVNFAQLVCMAFAVTLVCGIFLGLLAAPMGGWFGLIWSFFSLAIIFPVISSLWIWNYPQNGFLFNSETLLIPLCSAIGGGVPLYLMREKPLRYEALNPLREWLRGTWLLDPVPILRVGTAISPIALPFLISFYFTLPVFLSNTRYVSRIGFWETWSNSKRLAPQPGRRHEHTRNSCQSNLRQIMLGVLQYSRDYNGIFPPTQKLNNDLALFPYLKGHQIFQCPQEFVQYSGDNPLNGQYMDYWFNSRFSSLPEAAMTGPNMSVVWGDGNTGMGEGTANYAINTIPPGFLPATRHRNGANYAFADGHVKWLSPTGVSNTLPTTSSSPTMMP